MLIYILHNDKIVSFKLPKKISGSFILTDYDKDDVKRNLVTIEANGDNWIALSNNDVNIVINNQYVESVNLTNYNFYQLILYGTESILIYVCPAYEKSYSLYGLTNSDSIKIGSGSNNDIVFNFAGVAANQFELTKVNGSYYLKNLNTKIPIYVNKVRMDTGFLSNLDTIFVMGLKMVVVGNNFLINDPEFLGKVFSQKFSNPISYKIINDYNSDGKVYKNFYEEKDYFAKSPVFQVKLEHYIVSFSDPPEISDKGSEKQSTMMNVVPSGLMSITSLLSTYYTIQNYNKGKADRESLVTNLLMCLIMLITSIAWPFIQSGVEFIRHRMHFKRVKWKYLKYLKRKEKDILQLVNKQKITLITNYLSLDECLEAVYRRTSNLFSRHIVSNDFLKIRLGIGNFPFDCEFQYNMPDFSMEDTILYTKILELVEKYKYIPNVPITFSLVDNNKLAFISSDDSKYEYLYAVLLQILALHGYDELKIVTLTNNEGVEKLSFLKNLNHSWNAENNLRFFVHDIDTCQDVFNYLDRVYNSRDKDKTIDTYYLILTDCINVYRNQNIIDQVLNSNNDHGFSLVMFDSDINNIPNQCEYFVSYNRSEASVFQKEMKGEEIVKFKPELIYNENRYCDINNFSNILSNIPLKLKSVESGNLVSKLGFLEMYGVGNVSQLNADIRWKEDSIINSLSAPIGIDAHNNIIYLDLHEKRHGPHGLIAGMTGSGKSEFIVTYILSLAVNYSPEEVQFVLIDYKGGGLAGAFENRKTGVKLPHLSGTITNLDKSEMNRTLVSIQSELQKRQKKFNEAKEKLNTGTIDIYKYQKLHREGKLEDTVSHLFIICDEFAELKAQQPEFMDQLVSTARIGRSLGVHLILATQKPTGVVDDQIWSNSKFKVCCKVQTAEDSNEMIRRPDAAFLTDAGRFYLQVGYDQYFILGQSAYSGSKYIPSNKINTNTDNSIEFINFIGETIKSVEEEQEKVDTVTDYGEELTNILKYLIEIASSKNLKASKLWLDNISSNIYLSDIQEKYKDNYSVSKNIINPIIGEYDDPEHQSQGLVTLPLTTGGNCFIAGDAGSGKTTFISTVIYSTIVSHFTSEVNIYIIDYGSENLKRFAKAPQVADVITQDSSDKVEILFSRIKREIQNRKEKLSIRGVDYLSYIKKNDIDLMPNWLIIINGMDAFNESFQDLVADDLGSIIRESNKYGITFLVSSISPNSVSYSVLSQFSQKVALKFSETDNYSMLINTKLIPSSNPGRGLITISDNVYQFQTAQMFKEEVANDNLNYVIKMLNEKIPSKIPEIPLLPDIVSSLDLSKYITNFSNVPVGYNSETVLPTFYDFNNYINFIIGSSYSSITKFVNGLLKIMLKSGKVRAIILDGSGDVRIKVKDDNIKYYNSDFIKLIPFLNQNSTKYNDKENPEERMPIFIIGYKSIEDALTQAKNDNPEIMTLSELILSCKNSKVFKFVFLTTEFYSSSWDDAEWFGLYNNKFGICLGDDFQSQELISGKKRPDEYKIQLDSTLSTVVKNAEKEFVKYMVE